MGVPIVFLNSIAMRHRRCGCGCELHPPSTALSSRERQIVMAYLSDGPLMFNSVLPHGIPFQSHRLTSLDQSVGFITAMLTPLNG